MAKNVLETKKGVAHYKNNCLPGNECLVSNIMKEMDSHELSFLQSKIKPTEEKNSNKIVLIPEEEVKPNVCRQKKISSTKKFPLMAKSQRALKQLQHNRKIAKPRAHLAVISTSVKDKPVCNTNIHTKNAKILNTKTAKQCANDNSRKRTLESDEVRKISVPKKIKSDTVENPKPAVENQKDDNLESSDGESDFEKFVQQNKKRRKKCKTTKQFDEKQKNSKRDRLSSSELISDSNSRISFKVKKRKSVIESKQPVRKKSDVTISKTVYDSKEKNNSDIGDSFTTSGLGFRKKKYAHKSKTVQENVSDFSDPPARSELGCHRSVRKSDASKFKTVQESQEENDSDFSDSPSTSRLRCRRSKRKSDTRKSKTVQESTEENDSNFSDSPSTLGLGCRSKRTKRKMKNNTAKSVPLDDSAFYESPSTSSHTYRRSKRIKTSNKITEEPSQGSLNDTESELDFDADIYTRDTSESDVPDNETFTSRNVDTPFSEQDYTVASQQITIDNNSCHSDAAAVTPVTDYEALTTKTIDLQSKRQDNTFDNLTTSTENEPRIPFSNCKQHKQPNVNKSFNNSSVSTTNKHEDYLIDLCESGSEGDNTVNYTTSTSLQKEGSNSVAASLKKEVSNSEAVSLQNESNSVAASLQKEGSNSVAANVKNESSDESDIEIIDVIILENNRNNKASCMSTTTDNCQVNIKTEKGIPQPPQNTDIKPRLKLKNLESKNVNNEKNEAAYVTDICKDYTERNDRDKTVHHSETVQLDRPYVSVKKEKEDDDIIIIESNNTKNVKCSELLTPSKGDGVMSHLNSVVTGITNSLIEKELKLYEVACKNLKPKVTSFYENTNNLVTAFPQQGVGIGKDHKMILQELKNEFATYIEIIRTEESIGATFKSLEQNQAKKLMHLKSLLASHLKSNDVESSRIKKEIGLLMSSTELDSNKLGIEYKESSGVLCEDPSKEAKNSQHVCSSAQSSIQPQDLVTAASTIAARDVKPDITKLQTSISPPRSPAANSMSFGEKCVICGKDAVAACQSCARVFFCSNECGLKYWKAGHAKECGQ